MALWQRCRHSIARIARPFHIKILHVVPTYFPATRYGGPIQSVHGLCKGLVELGHKVDVYTTNVDGSGVSDVPLGQAVDLDGVRVSYFATGFLRRIYRSPGMKQRLKETIAQFDVVHIHSMFLWPGLLASRTARKAGVPYLLSPRGMLVHDLIQKKSRLLKRAWLRLFDGSMLENASAVHVTSPREAEDISAFGLRLPPLINVSNGVDSPPDFKNLVDFSEIDFLLYLGRIDPKKGLELLIEAMRLLPDAHLVVAGDGDEDYVNRLLALVIEYGLQQQIEFIGHLDNTIKWQYYQKAMMLILPSNNENFGNVVLEAMVCGCPVIVSPGVGLSDIVNSSGSGIVADRDPIKIAAAIQKLTSSLSTRKSMGANGASLAHDNFSWEKIALEMAGHYEQIRAHIDSPEKSAATNT